MNENYLTIAKKTLEEIARNPSMQADLTETLRPFVRKAIPDPNFPSVVGMQEGDLKIYNPQLLVQYFPALKEEIPLKFRP